MVIIIIINKMIAIKDFKLGLPPKIVNELFVRPIINSTSDKSCNTYYEVIANETIISKNEQGEDVESITKTVLATGNCPISENQYAKWAKDNSVIEDIVIKYLGLERK